MKKNDNYVHLNEQIVLNNIINTISILLLSSL